MGRRKEYRPKGGDGLRLGVNADMVLFAGRRRAIQIHLYFTYFSLHLNVFLQTVRLQKSSSPPTAKMNWILRKPVYLWETLSLALRKVLYHFTGLNMSTVAAVTRWLMAIHSACRNLETSTTSAMYIWNAAVEIFARLAEPLEESLKVSYIRLNFRGIFWPRPH